MINRNDLRLDFSDAKVTGADIPVEGIAEITRLFQQVADDQIDKVLRVLAEYLKQNAIKNSPLEGSLAMGYRKAAIDTVDYLEALRQGGTDDNTGTDSS